MRMLKAVLDELGPKQGALVVDTAAPTPLF
jgi:hypothetical protein